MTYINALFTQNATSVLLKQAVHFKLHFFGCCPENPKLSMHVPANAIFLCDQAAVLGEAIKEISNDNHLNKYNHIIITNNEAQRYQISTTLKNNVFWDVTLCSLVEIY